MSKVNFSFYILHFEFGNGIGNTYSFEQNDTIYSEDEINIITSDPELRVTLDNLKIALIHKYPLIQFIHNHIIENKIDIDKL